MFINKRVFDPSLKGRAVCLESENPGDNGVYLVAKVENEKIMLVDHCRIVTSYNVEYFDEPGNRLKLMEVPQRVHNEPQPTRKHRPGLKRQYRGPRTFRSPEQRRRENHDIERILRESIEPMQLAKLIQAMRDLGHEHWSNKNGSSFVQQAIRSGMNVYKVQTGVYAYGWEGKA